MARSTVPRSLLACILPAGLALGCAGLWSAPTAVLVDGTGTYSRPISTDSDLAQRFFDQGLRLTWGYYFPEAAASFQQALKHDAHPMIYWGLALAISPNPNSRYMGFPDDPAGEGKLAIEQAVRLAAAATPKEREFIDALFVRYDDRAHPDVEERDRAYVDAATLLAERYPKDPDAATLLADAVMTTSPWSYWSRDGSARPGTLGAVEGLERAMQHHPQHPGANHLYIHLVEASPQPEQALPQAERLESLMPRAGHVVHMPSHIYVRVGRYEDAILTNERSIEADRYFLEQWGDSPFPPITSHKLSARIHAWHANDFIRCAATVQGNYARAIATARQAAAVAVERQALDDGRTQRAVATVWLVHRIFGRWDALLRETAPAPGLPFVDGLWHYARGSALVATRELELAGVELEELETARRAAPERQAGLANSPQTLLAIAAHGLRGQLALARGDAHAAVDEFERAVAREDALRYIEPPDWPQPMRHHLGAALLEAGAPEEAERVYRSDLRWSQGDGWALYGLAQSLRAQARTAEADEAEARFERAWRGADVELGASRF